MTLRRLSTLFAVAPLIAAAAPTSQQPADPTELSSTGSEYFEVQARLEAWRAVHGDAWQVIHDGETGKGRLLFGGSAAPAFAPRSEADFAVLARNALVATQDIHGLDPGSLVEERVTFLPLGNAGSTDKMTVHFRQDVDGVRVLGGYANVLFDLSGRLLSVDTTGLPGLGAGFSILPALEAGEALDAALGLFATDTGLPPTSVGLPELVIEQVLEGKRRTPRLAWQVDVLFEGSDAEPEGYLYRIDAVRGGLLNRRSVVHHFDVSGTVRSMATPGAFPDKSTNPEQQIVMPHLRVTSSQGNAVTDSNGDFTIVGASAPLQVTVTYDGTYCQTYNEAQADYSLTTTLGQASGNQVLMNPSAQDLVTAEANGLNWIGQMRDWTRSVNPADPTSDFLANSNVNISSTCNAYYNGSSVNFYRAGGGCANTAFSSVVIHEMGHWMNDRYGSGNGSDGFGEGNADNFSTHILEDPIVGHDFCGTGCNVRDANNSRQFCGDCCGGCYGQVHADGEVLMGAMWKVRTRLKNTLGQAAGALASNTLFNGWMNAYDDSQIKTIIEIHYLTLDDDDGNIGNGTPNYDAINEGFKDQGFPGYKLHFVTFSNVTLLGNTTNEAGPYVVDADITATFNPPVTAPTLYYRVDGGTFAPMAMIPLGGGTWRGGIPGQISPAKVEYYLEADDALGQSNAFPEDGPASPIKFYVGIVNSWFLADFEGGTAGWTHGSPNGTQDDWHLSSQYGVTASFGKSGDPTTAPSGTSIWGNDLGPSGWNGAYSDNVNNYLRSPTMDLSQAKGSTLVFKRWLTVEKGQYDQATIKVNGQPVWTNPFGTDLLDSEWTDVEIDISSIADGNPNVQIEFGLQTDAGLTFGGWNIDDVEVLTIDPVCPPPTSYCTAKLTSSATLPVVGSTGSPSAAGGGFAVTLAGAIPSTNTIPIWAAQQGSTPFNGGTLCVTPPLTRGPVGQTSATGTASHAVTVTPAMVGTTLNYQWWFRDVADPFGVGLSDGLNVIFCN